MDEMPVVRWGPLRLDVQIGVYGTVLQLTVLVVALDDGIEDFAEAAQIIIGPLVATFAAHLFAAVLARTARPGSALPTRAELGHMVRHAAQFLLLAVVPLVVVVAGAVTGLYDPVAAVDAVIWLGLAFLVMVGGVGGWRTGRGLGGALAGALAAGVLGLIVLVLRVVLEH